MRKIIFILLVIFTGVLFFIAFNKVFCKNTEMAHRGLYPNRPDRIGEVITYDVRLAGINLGRAVFKYLPETQLKGKKVNLMLFETKLANFSDLERIYSDKNSLLPIRVERLVSIWPSTEKLIEDYDQQRFILTVKKFKGRKEQETVIRKDSVINNAILLPFYVRDIAGLDIGYELKANLPTQEFLIKLVAKEEVFVPAGKFIAYRFESVPKNFEIWISQDERRIPLKIKGASRLGYTLLLRNYSKK